MSVSGFEKLQRDLKNLESALSSLTGTIADLQIDPNDEASVQAAIRNMEQSIDRKVAPYGRNEMVVKITKEAKNHYRRQILDLVQRRKASGIL